MHRPIIDKPYLRFAVLVSIAVPLAYCVAGLVPFTDPVITAVTAALTVQPTLHRSVKEITWQILGLGIAVGLGYLASMTEGYDALFLAAAVAFGFIAAGLLKIDMSSCLIMIVPIILIVGPPDFNLLTVEARAASVLLGSIFGILMSLIVLPGSPTARVLSDTTDQASAVADVVHDIAHMLPQDELEPQKVEQWERKLGDVSEKLVELKGEANDALVGVRWSPLLRKEQAETVLEQVEMTQETATAAASMTRNLKVMQKDWDGADNPLPPPVAESLREVLVLTAGVIAEQASEAAAGNPAAPANPQVPVVEKAEQARRDAIQAVRNADDTGPIVLGAALVRDSEKIEKTLISDPLRRTARQEASDDSTPSGAT